MPIELLIQETQGLSNEAIMEVVRFVRFIKNEAQNDPALAVYPEKKKYRTAGKYRGQAWIAEDFDAPLEDFKEYMQ